MAVVLTNALALTLTRDALTLLPDDEAEAETAAASATTAAVDFTSMFLIREYTFISSF